MSSNPLRSVRTTIRRSGPYDIHHSASTRRHQSTEYSSGITIISLSDRDSVDRLLRPHVRHNSSGPSSQNYEIVGDHLYVTSDPFEFILSFLDLLDQEVNYMVEEKDPVLLGYFNTRIHVDKSDDEEICVICQAKFENEDTIGTLGCGHEYHAECINQWMLRKKNCPMCGAPVTHFTSA
ncbi:hypothetical protein HAX54_000491 [Datura stramonium]|uniref:RING-type E3 ubiquitin transferase n=1 Tax=Datura stramonium TaxID=4076 RepID=A0ABS8WQ03_DATST|nr:hypothetical protein [Datura stramonium]